MQIINYKRNIVMRFRRLFLRIFYFVCITGLCLVSNASEIKSHLSSIPGVASVEEISAPDFFEEKYLIRFEQYLDINDPFAGVFEQRIFVSHKNINSPVVFITEGYSAGYGSSASHVNELSDMLNANQILVEHRFFGESVPANVNYDYLTASAAADDLHRIRTAFSEVYRGKWLSTGISKGGQNSVIYRMFYPDDVSLTVAYVAPFARGLIDGRHEQYIPRIGSGKERKAVRNFQKELLKRRDEIIPIFKNQVQASNLTFHVPVEEIYDYCVLEYSFAFWQWVGNTDRIPHNKADNMELLSHLMAVSGPDYFSIEGIEPVFPFFYQAAKELGYYSYDIKGFEKIIGVTSTDDYFNNIFLGNKYNIEFDNTLISKLEEFIKTKANNIIFIYGEFDPWTSVKADIGENPNVIKIISPRGTHGIRIKSMPKQYHEQIINMLNKWAE
jgi:hypothetical protein